MQTETLLRKTIGKYGDRKILVTQTDIGSKCDPYTNALKERETERTAKRKRERKKSKKKE